MYSFVFFKLQSPHDKSYFVRRAAFFELSKIMATERDLNIKIFICQKFDPKDFTPPQSLKLIWSFT